ncbi:MAG: DUF4142 domain-containing protein [Meiothermus sp.]|nr:DUF4142 domain-containing protein [Meiothermus sp.]
MNRAVIGWTVALTLTGLAGAQTQNQQNQQNQQQTQPGVQLRDNPTLTRAMQALGQSNLFEVMSSESAVQRDVQGQVREFAQRMITEHRQNQQQLETLSRRLGVTLPTSVGAANEARIRTLERQTGAGLARTYLQAQVNGHRTTLTTLETAIRALGGQTQGQGNQPSQGQSTQPQGGQGQGQGQGNQTQPGQDNQTQPGQGQGGTTEQNQGQGQGQGGNNQQNQDQQAQQQGEPTVEEVLQFLEQAANVVRRHLQEAQQLLQSNR